MQRGKKETIALVQSDETEHGMAWRSHMRGSKGPSKKVVVQGIQDTDAQSRSPSNKLKNVTRDE